MQRRQLGQLEVSAIALGPIYDATSDTEIDSLVSRALELGIDLIDTSDAYQGGEHEASLGRVLHGSRRSKAILATKFGNLRDKDGRPAGVNGRPDYVVEACERSLRTLKTDVIDLYYIHRIDPDVPIEDTVGAMALLQSQGKIRHLGICEAAPETLRRAYGTCPISALQTEYSLWSRDPENEHLDVCDELNIGFVAYSPLGRGFLSGEVSGTDNMQGNDLRRTHPRFQPENIQKNLHLIEEMKVLADREGCSLAQLSLAWLLEQGNFIVPVPGTRRIDYLEDNAASTDITLMDETLVALNRLFSDGAVAGERYPRSCWRELTFENVR